ncbi:RHS repeat-associated core domain-containing protein [Microbulbifer sp. DLAB2-AF]|uniref:RHS repeat-associated core domain-containing protein n=1 Tax=Microbulbifer sp. DLAB2-AF TaxID=3243395 RepID=UPI004039230D
MHQKSKALAYISRAVIAFSLAASSVSIFAEQKEPEKLLGTRMSIQPMDLKRDLSREDLIAAGQLGGHLYPTEEHESSDDKVLKAKRQDMRLKFGEAIQNWNHHEYKRAYQQFKTYAEDYPDSPWAGEAKLHMACEARYNGRYTEAEQTFNEIIQQYSKSDYAGSQMLADKAKSRLAVLKVLENNRGEAIKYLSDLKANAKDWRLRTYASNWIQRIGRQNANDVSLLDCGSRALAHLLKKQGRVKEAKEVLAIQPGEKGQSLAELKTMANQYGIAVTAMELNMEQLKSVPLPAIVQINSNGKGGIGHYWIVEKIRKGVVTLRDPQIPRRFKQTLKEFQREWSGNALVFSEADGLPGRVLAKEERDQIYGGCCGVQRPEDDLGDPDGDDSSPEDDDECSEGAPIWRVNPVNMNFYMVDTPIWYTPAYGPKVRIKLSYNSQSSIAQHEPFGNKWAFNYSSYLLVDPGETVTVFMPDGRRDVYIPDSDGVYASPYGVYNKLIKLKENHFLLQFLDGSEFEYAIPDNTDSMQPFLVRQTDKNGFSLTFGYDANIHLTSITDATNQVTNLTYNAEGLVKTITDPFQRTATFEYDTDRNLVKLTDMGGYWTEIGYDADIYVSSVKNPLGEWSFYFEPAVSQSNGTIVYPAPGDPMWENYRITITNPEGGKEEYFYNGYSGYSWYVSPEHYVEYVDQTTNNFKTAPQTKYEFTKVFNNVGRIKKVTNPEGDYLSYTYDNSTGLVTAISDAAGKTTRYSYNDKGKVTQITLPDGQVTTFTYEESNGVDLTSITTALGSVEIGYDEKRRPTSFKDIDTKSTTVTYNAFGQLETVTDALQQVTRYSYNTNQHLEQIHLSNQLLASYTYDAKGRLKTSTDATNFTLEYSYNDLNSLTEVSYPDGGTESYNYASCPRLMQDSSRRGGRTTTYSYDKMKRLVEESNSSSWKNRYVYDANSNLVEFIDANQNRTRFSYDKNDRLKAKTYADDQGVSYQYNNRGLLSKITNARGIEISYTYDDNGNQLTTSYSDDTPSITYTYDDHDRLASIQDGVGTTTFSYNTNSTIATIDGPWESDTIAYTYDDHSRIKTLVVENGPQREYIYDTLNRLKDIKVGSQTYTYQYVGNSGLIDSLTLPNQTLSKYAYDGMNRLQQLTNKTIDEQLLTDYQFTYNDRDLIATESRTDTLPYVGVEEQVQFANNELNQTTEKGEETFLYDADGNMTQGYTPEGHVFTASYDAENRLKELTYTDSTGILHRKAYTYYWNSLLAQIQSYQDGQLTDEQKIVRAGFLPIQDRDGSNAPLRDYLWGQSIGGGIGGLLSMSAGGQDYYYHYDGRGNVTSVTDSLQQKVAEYTYTEYGSINNQTGTLDQPFRFSTKRWDESTGLSYFGYRYYIPANSKWLTRDPIAESGGINIYEYVVGNPINRVDPEGLWANVLAGVGVRVIGGRAAGAAISRGLQGALGRPAGRVFSCLLIGYCSEEADDGASEEAPGSGNQCPAPTDKRHSPDQQALNDLINDLTYGGRLPLSGSDADTILDWADELGIEGARDDRGKDHWAGGEHIHVPGSGINHIPTK